VRFMFYRLIAHQIERMVHLTKTLRSLGSVQVEAEMILEDLLIGLNDDDL